MTLAQPFKEGDEAVIPEHISKRSYLIYNDYRRQSSTFVCPCSLKRKKVKISRLFADTGVALCTYKDAIITIIAVADLEQLP